MAAPATRMARKPDLRIDPDADAAATASHGCEAPVGSSPRAGKDRPKTPQSGSGVRIQKHSMALLRKAFNAYDEEHSGRIPVSAVGVALWSCGIAVPAGEETHDVLSSVIPDFDPEGRVTFDHFLQVARDLEQRNYASSPRPVDASGFSPEASPRSPKSPGKAPGRRKSLSRRAILSDTWEVGSDDEQLSATLRQLEEQRKMYEDEGNYQEASRIAKRVQEIKVGEESKRMAAMDERQAQELSDAESAYRAEVDETNALWDEKMAEFQESVMEQVARLRDAHADATRLLRANLETRRPTKPQPSTKLLDQRKIQHALGKQGKYDEADQVKRNADKMEQQELQAADAAWQSELGMREQTLAGHQQVEMEALMQRATRGRDELRKARSIDLERREQRYRNVRTELEAVHRLEALRFEGNLEKKIIAGKRDEKTVASNLGLKARRASVSARSRKTSKVSYSAYV